MIRMAVATSLAVVTLLAGPFAHAAPDGADVVSVKVNVADLNLATRAGAKSMLERLRTATRDICGYAPSPANIQAMTDYHACFDQTLAGAVRAVGSPLVSEAFAESGGTSSALAMASVAK